VPYCSCCVADTTDHDTYKLAATDSIERSEWMLALKSKEIGVAVSADRLPCLPSESEQLMRSTATCRAEGAPQTDRSPSFFTAAGQADQ